MFFFFLLHADLRLVCWFSVPQGHNIRREKNAIFSWTVQQMESWMLIYLKVEGLEPLILIMYLTLGTIRNCNSKVTVLLTFREQRALATVNNILYCYLFWVSTGINFRTSCHLLSSAMLALVLEVKSKGIGEWGWGDQYDKPVM